jgi:hypothetical protein
VTTAPQRPAVEYTKRASKHAEHLVVSRLGEDSRMLQNTSDFDKLLRKVFERRCSREELRELDEMMQ